MNVTQQRESMLASLARIEEWQRNYELMALERNDRNEKDHKKIEELLKEQNGRIRVNEKGISRIIGVGLGIAFVLGLAIGLVKFL